MRNRINRMKMCRMQEQGLRFASVGVEQVPPAPNTSSAKLIFIGLRLVSVRVLNRYETDMVSRSNISPNGTWNPETGNIRGRRRLSGLYGNYETMSGKIWLCVTCVLYDDQSFSHAA